MTKRRRFTADFKAKAGLRIKRAQLLEARRGDKTIQEIAVRWTRLSWLKFRDNQVRLQLHALAYHLASFMRTLASPKAAERWPEAGALVCGHTAGEAGQDRDQGCQPRCRPWKSTGIKGQWLSGHGTTETSGHRMAAAGKRFQRRRHLGAIAMKLMLIWEMSA